uniref:Uncharacterized protein n=1 Tax=Dulem virus 42 TaxID=3145760 RepID=A0AAU8BBE9_9CAUD
MLQMSSIKLFIPSSPNLFLIRLYYCNAYL